jgi:hypothetical protein
MLTAPSVSRPSKAGICLRSNAGTTPVLAAPAFATSQSTMLPMIAPRATGRCPLARLMLERRVAGRYMGDDPNYLGFRPLIDPLLWRGLEPDRCQNLFSFPLKI